MLEYFIIINILSFFTYGIDKYLAIKKRRRISEKQLLTYAIIGGSIGSILGMITFHHKTLKLYFWLINFLFLILWCLIFIN